MWAGKHSAKRVKSVLGVVASLLIAMTAAAQAPVDLGDPLDPPVENIDADVKFVANEILLAFRPGIAAPQIDAMRQTLDATQIQQFSQIGVHHWKLPPGLTVEQAVAALSADPNVKYAEPNYIVHALGVPNDPRFGELWGLHNSGQTGGTLDADIDAPEAWDIQTGSRSVVVAVIDTGVDYVHEDLAMNIWINESEIPTGILIQLIDIDGDGVITFWDLNNPINQGPGTITDLNGNGMIDGGDLRFPVAQGGWADDVDTDGNTYLDDLIGVNIPQFLFGNPPDNEPRDWHGHGTHVAGTIGAAGDNGIGVAGVNWRVRIMPVRFLNSNASGSTADAITSILYAASFVDGFGNKVVRITNNSWGGGSRSDALEAAIASSGALFVAAAGNSGHREKLLPAGYDLANIISVAATDHNDVLADFSSWHPTAVDLGAPGVDVLSTVPTYPENIWDPSGYRLLDGTSMATPHVAGVAALVMGQDPTLDVLAVKDRILSTVDPLASLAGKTLTGGRLNAVAALPPLAGPGITVAPTEGLITTEAGEADAFTVVLNTQPAADVFISLASSDFTEGMVSPAWLVFTPSDWNLPQQVIVIGVDDAIVDGNIPYTILTDPAISSDPDYDSLDAADVSVTNLDDDAPGVTISSIAPNSMQAGTQVNVTITGSGFQSGTTVTFENGTGGTPTGTVTFVSGDGRTINVTVAAPGGGPRGSRVWDVRVTNPDASTDVLIDGFTVVR